jgi:hypothetical protein
LDPYCQNGSKTIGILARQYLTSNFKSIAKIEKKNDNQRTLVKKQTIFKKILINHSENHKKMITGGRQHAL